MNYTDVKNPQWHDAAHTTINCEINFDHLAEEYVGFTASPNDCEAHGVEIFNRCVSGDFGVIAEMLYSPCTINKTEILADGVDEAIISSIPIGATATIIGSSEVVTDGEVIVTSAVAKEIVVRIVLDGYEDYQEIIYAS